MSRHWSADPGRGARVDAWEKGLVLPTEQELAQLIEVLELPEAETWALWRAAVAEAEADRRPQG